MSQQPPEQSPHILEYDLSHQTGVDAMMEGIAGEFVEAISGPGSTRLNEVYDRPEQKFWVALHEGELSVCGSADTLCGHFAQMFR